ncbi:26S proteasome regulatory subunit [Venturia nashicola]|uniref:26S proteasome regulatory subunit n=1 Tax=Venturia nashicola TaxID=86259 RepID=A0A4Z1PNW0_9PEZI|nr:26S proteasome regulatory subunit [Venturia nashicola]TLD36862.1 26S proteasome regulatory subunit [Venturia nashicola]
MKLTPAFLIATLVSSISATAYDNCCCTKRDNKHSLPYCDKDAGDAVIKAYGDRYAWSAHYWDKLFVDGPKYPGYYLYATGNGEGKKNQDHRIGAQEIGKACGKQHAGQSCFRMPKNVCINYKGDVLSKC